MSRHFTPTPCAHRCICSIAPATSFIHLLALVPISNMVDQVPSMSQTSRGLRLRIDTSVPSPSLAVPQNQGSRWLTPTTPSTPGLLRSTTTTNSVFSPWPVTPSSPLPGHLGSAMLQKQPDIDARGEENSIYSKVSSPQQNH